VDSLRVVDHLWRDRVTYSVVGQTHLWSLHDVVSVMTLPRMRWRPRPSDYEPIITGWQSPPKATDG
jgi:hypothetical protein